MMTFALFWVISSVMSPVTVPLDKVDLIVVVGMIVLVVAEVDLTVVS